MSDTSPTLHLPLIQPSQAQKHVTHNEAIMALDHLVHLRLHGGYRLQLRQTRPKSGRCLMWARARARLGKVRMACWLFARRPAGPLRRLRTGGSLWFCPTVCPTCGRMALSSRFRFLWMGWRNSVFAAARMKRTDWSLQEMRAFLRMPARGTNSRSTRRAGLIRPACCFNRVGPDALRSGLQDRMILP